MNAAVASSRLCCHSAAISCRYFLSGSLRVGRNIGYQRHLSSSSFSTSTFSSTTTTTVDSGPILIRTLDDHGVLTLTLNRPKQRNALNQALLEELNGALTEAAAAASATASAPTTDVRVVVVQSEGPVFSSGHDLKELLALCKKDEEEEEGNDSNHQYNNSNQVATRPLFDLCSATMQLLSNMPQPTICAVQGLATAAGCQLVTSCDIVLASPRAAFQTPGVNLGLFCHTPAVPLLRSVPVRVATDMLLTGRVVSSTEALQYGLVSRLAGNPQKEAAKVAHTLATAHSYAALQKGKRVLLEQQLQLQQQGSLSESYEIANKAMAENMDLWDATHGIESFLKKETPSWRHE